MDDLGMDTPELDRALRLRSQPARSQSPASHDSPPSSPPAGSTKPSGKTSARGVVVLPGGWGTPHTVVPHADRAAPPEPSHIVLPGGRSAPHVVRPHVFVEPGVTPAAAPAAGVTPVIVPARAPDFDFVLPTPARAPRWLLVGGAVAVALVVGSGVFVGRAIASRLGAGDETIAGAEGATYDIRPELAASVRSPTPGPRALAERAVDSAAAARDAAVALSANGASTVARTPAVAAASPAVASAPAPDSATAPRRVMFDAPPPSREAVAAAAPRAIIAAVTPSVRLPAVVVFAPAAARPLRLPAAVVSLPAAPPAPLRMPAVVVSRPTRMATAPVSSAPRVAPTLAASPSAIADDPGPVARALAQSVTNPAPWMLGGSAGAVRRRTPPNESGSARLGRGAADVAMLNGVTRAVAAYAAAISARDVAALSRVYPVITSAERAYWSELFTRSSSIDARLVVRDARRVGDDALVRVSGRYRSRMPGLERPAETTVEFVALLVREANGDWRIEGIR